MCQCLSIGTLKFPHIKIENSLKFPICECDVLALCRIWWVSMCCMRGYVKNNSFRVWPNDFHLKTSSNIKLHRPLVLKPRSRKVHNMGISKLPVLHHRVFDRRYLVVYLLCWDLCTYLNKYNYDLILNNALNLALENVILSVHVSKDHKSLHSNF